MSDKDDGPWTADDIRKNAPNWSLHCDGKLLEYMKHLSKTIEERGNRTTYNLHSSMLELDRTKIALENATNNLMALQHKQFVENRVYDDDETLANVDNVPVTDTNPSDKPSVSAADALRNALEIGMQIMDQHFDRVTYELSDSDDDGEEVEKSVIFRPKNPYKHRPLPYLIGSKEWHAKWHIGLTEEDSDQSDNDNNENADDEEEGEASSSGPSSPAISVSSNVPISMTDSENPTGVAPSKRSNAQDLFESSSEENVPKFLHEIADSDLKFRRQSHETASIVQNIKRPNDSHEINTNNSIFMPQKQQITHAIPTLIDSDPPDLDDVPAVSRNAQKPPPNLFLDDEDGDDFIGRNESVARGGDRKVNSINLFADDDDDNDVEDKNQIDDFDGFLPTTSKPANARSSLQKSEPIRNLFDNDDESDEEEEEPPFIEPAPKIPIPFQPNRSTILSSAPKTDNLFQYNLFDDKPPEDEFETAPKKQSNLLSTKVNLFAEDDDDDDIFEKLITPTSKKQPIHEDNKTKSDLQPSTSTQIDEMAKANDATTAQLMNKVNLFDDTPPSDDEQLFAGISKKGDKTDTSEPKPVEVVKKVAAREFYNDFSETVTAISHANKTTDDPPKESMQTNKMAPALEKTVPASEQSSAESEAMHDQSIEEEQKSKPAQNNDDGLPIRSDFMKKIDAFSNVNKSERKSEIAAPVPKARQPNKLNIGSIDINVAALLPGAKRTKSVENTDNREMSAATDDISSDDTLTTPQIPTIAAATINQDNVDNSGRLVNLNRNRAKKLSRRPSTRAGRKEQYQKSVDLDSQEHIDGVISNDLDNNIVSPEPIALPNNNITKASFEDEDEDEDEPMKPTEEDIKETTEAASSISILNENEQIASEDGNPFAFLDFIVDNDENDDFLCAEPETQSTYTSAVSIKATPAYIDELPPDLEDPVNGESYDNENVKKSLLSQNALSLFGDDDDDDDFESDEIFRTEKIDNQPDIPSDPNKSDENWSPFSTVEQKSPPSLVGKQHQVSSALSLFDDDADELDDSDMFGTKTSKDTTKSKEETKPSNLNERSNSPTMEQIFDSDIPKMDESPIVSPTADDKKMPESSVLGLFDDDDHPNKAALLREPETKSMAPKTSLFDDQDDDGSLFGPPPLPEPNKQRQPPKKVSQKIFSDDSSDDDLFGAGKTAAQKSIAISSTSNIPKTTAKNTKTRDKLFSDSEDDDLFGNKSKSTEAPSRKVKSSGTIKEDQTKPAKMLSPSSNDPLADLLK